MPTRLTAAFPGIVASARRCALALAAVVTLLGVSGSSDPAPGALDGATGRSDSSAWCGARSMPGSSVGPRWPAPAEPASELASFTLREQPRGPLALNSGGFTKVTTGDIVTIPAWYWNGSWGDYDDDGWLDLFVGSSYASTTNYLYHNERDGTFALIDQAAMPKSPSNQHGSVWGDYDNDGHLDLIVTSGNPELAQNMLYRNDGDGTFSWITEGPLYTQSGTFHAPGWGDYDNDGFLDLFIAGHGAVNRLFHNEGDGSFTRNSSHRVVLDVAGSFCSAFVDYDNDGDIDLFVCNAYSYANFLYRNDGHGVFTSVTDSGLSNVEVTIGCSWADYDNDGFLDLFLANAGTNSLYHNEGDGTFTSVADVAGVQDVLPATYVFGSPAWGDYDNDGFIDLFVSVGNCYTGPCEPPFHSFLYHNEGDGTFSKVTDGIVVTDPTSSAPGASWGDYDNDGFLDLFVSQGYFEPEPHINLLYHNDGNANAWLNVKLAGTRSNRSAIGAKVRVNAFYRGASRWQLREVSGGDSGANQQSLNAEFGLGDATTIDTLRVEWPSGAVQELHDVAPRQFMTITEPGVRPTCADGVDNDGDGLADMDDPGCPFPLASPENPQCDDGLDNDGNGQVDFADPKCQPEWPYWEALPCGLGAELALLLPLLGVAARRRPARRGRPTPLDPGVRV